MAAALRAESRKLLVFVSLAALSDQVGVRVVGRPRLGALAADDAEPLLGQVRAGKVVGEVGGREDQRAVVEQEPRLLKAAFEQIAKNERRDMDLIVERSGDSPEAALRAEVLVHTVGALVRLSMDQLLHHHSPEPFRDLLARRLATARTVFAQKAD